MKIKVCGIRKGQNLSFLENSKIDYIGFIFYEKSKRDFADGDLSEEQLKTCQKKKIGVFVNEDINVISEVVRKYSLDGVQLHGDESPAYTLALKASLANASILLFKAFSILDVLPKKMEAYEEKVDYFLLDTKGSEYGGNGFSFNWSVLDEYNYKTPFILSGGIGSEDVSRIKEMKHSKLHAIDVNSRFEIEPGIKDNELLGEFINKVKKTA